MSRLGYEGVAGVDICHVRDGKTRICNMDDKPCDAKKFVKATVPALVEALRELGVTFPLYASHLPEPKPPKE